MRLIHRRLSIARNLHACVLMSLPLASLHEANWHLLHRGALVPLRTVLPETSMREVTHQHLLLFQLGHGSALHVCYIEAAGRRDGFFGLGTCCFLGIS